MESSRESVETKMISEALQIDKRFVRVEEAIIIHQELCDERVLVRISPQRDYELADHPEPGENNQPQS